MVELDGTQAVELNDDVTVVVDAHQHALGTLELAVHDSDIAALLAFKLLGGDIGQGVFVVGDHTHETVHLAVGHGDGGTHLATMQLVTTVLYIVQLIGILGLQLGELLLVGLDDNEVDHGRHETTAGVAFLVVADGPLHGHEVLDAQHIEEGLHAEDLLRARVIDTQGVPMKLGSRLNTCTRGSCRL